MRRNPLAPWLFLAPALVIYTAFRIVPLLGTVGLSLTRYGGLGIPSFVGLGNYVRLVEDGTFWAALRHNVIWGLSDVLASVAIGLFLAVLLNSKIKGRVFFRTALFLPVVLSWSVVGLLWDRIYNPIASFGLLNHLLLVSGHPGWMHNWLGDASTALGAVIVAAIWKDFGFSMVIFLAGLQDIPQSLLEAAQLDGARDWQLFWRVTFPLLRPIVSIVLVLGLIDTFRVFDPIWIMTQGGPGNATDVIGTQVFQVAFTDFNLGYGSTIAVAMLALALLSTLGYFRVFGLGEGS